METVRTVAALRARVEGWRREGLRSAVVPTMGGLHAGHLSLVKRGLAEADRVVATLFVNPTQFSPSEDLAAYPRDEAADAAMLESAGCHLLFAPPVEVMYPPGFSTEVRVTGITDCLCGAVRAGHFDGVAQIVTKLLNQARTDAAIFGEKDWQQLQVVTRLAADLDIPTRIVGSPTIREADLLALSSRNRYLGENERSVAAALPRVMEDAVAAIRDGADAGPVTQNSSAALVEAGFASVDYLELRDGTTFEARERMAPGARLFVAARLGRARLIDNWAL